ncbi:unnamed protein product [Peronospora belbahrii]|uniref:CCHC-type domain-containing protein n=1 Tax=Peronospora belbahrii TaxID=622444 RepID=A0AAU9KUT5_9STRA|nr:unnamed protein product [Peronospora belbahrii]
MVAKKKVEKSNRGGCFLCGGTGHYKRDCPDLEEKPRERRAQVKYARSEEEFTHPKPKTFQVSQVNDTMEKRNAKISEVVKQVSKDFDSSRWYFDIGINAHITGMDNCD